MSVIEILSTYYGLEKISITQDTTGLVDENYAIRSNSGMYFFKLFRSISAQEFASLEHTLTLLNSQGVPCPEIVPPTSGLPVSMPAVMLFKYVAGEIFNGTLTQLKSIATLQRRIIEIGLPTKIPADVQVLHEWVTKTSQALQPLDESYPLTSKHHTVWRYFMETLREIEPAIHDFPATVYLVSMHPDFTERNMLFDETGAVNLICDWQGYGPRMLPVELADFLVRFGLNQPFRGILNQEHLRLILDTLTESHPFLDELVGQYQDHFSILMMIKQIANFPFRIDCYYTGNQPDLMAQIINWSFDFVQWLAQTRNDPSFLMFLK